jgi:2'-5' RNA ligase
VAVELGPRAATALGEVDESLRGAAPTWTNEKWVPVANLHATVKFLGDLPETVLPILAADLATAAAGCAPFALRGSCLAARPSPGRCGLVWVEFANHESRFAALADAVDSVAADYGVALETHGVRPHVTLVRARRRKPFPREALDSGSVLVNDLMPAVSVVRATLFTSTLTHTAPVYDPVAFAPLMKVDEG